MNTHYRWWGVATLFFCAAFTGAISESSPGNQSSTTSPTNVATVNGRSISTKVYEMYLRNGREALGLDLNTEEGRNKFTQLRENIVSELIDRTLITIEAERRKLALSPEQLTEAERKSIVELGGEQQYDSYLAAHRLTRDEYRDVLRMQVYGELLRAELNKGLSVSSEAISAYYKKHHREQPFQKQDRVTAAHILIAARPNQIAQQLRQANNLSGAAVSTAVQTEMAQRRRHAEALRLKAAGGADFAALARASSDDQGTRAQGGDLGSFTRNSHPRSFDDAAFALKPGMISRVVQTEYGFHIIKVSAHERARTLTLAEATPAIHELLVSRLEAAKLTDWLKRARREAAVHIDEPYRIGTLKHEFPTN